MVGAEGFEPSTTCVQDRYANQTALHTVLNLLVADREGFEPSIQVLYSYAPLAGEYLHPLGHLSAEN